MNLPENISYSYNRIIDIPLDQAATTLSEKELIYLDSVSHEKRKREFTAGRILARTQAASLLQIDPREVKLEICNDGSLDLLDTPYSISLAHSRNGACAAIGYNTTVGIDLEMIKVRHERLHEFILSKEEYHLLDALPYDRDRILILSWVLKEATLKGMRTGFRCSPKKLQLHIDPDNQEAEIAAPGNATWKAHYTELDNAYLAVSYPMSSPRTGKQMGISI